MKKFLFISLLFIGLSSFFSSEAEAQNTIRLQSKASVTMEGVYVLYSNGWGANILEETSEDYLMPSTSMDIGLPSTGEWTIRLWDREHNYIIRVNVTGSDITYVTITDDLLRRSIAE